MAVNLIFAVLLLGILCLIRLPALELFSSHLLGGNGPDTNLYIWLVNSTFKNFAEYGWFETNSFYPYRDTLAFSDSFLPVTVIYNILRFAGLNEIQSWNSIMLSAQFLNGFCTFILCRKLGGKTVVAFLISLIFLSSAYFTEHLGHPQLQFFFFTPLGLYLFIRLLETPGLLPSLAFAVLIVCAFCISVYHTICTCFCCFIFFIFRRKISDIRHLVPAGFLTAVLILPVIIPYLRIKDLFGSRGLHEFYHFSLSAGSFFSASPLSEFYSALNLSHPEANFFWGIGCLILILLTLFQIFKADKTLFIALIATLLLSEKLLFSFLGRETRLVFCAIFAWFTFIRLLSVSLQKHKLPPPLACGVIVLLVALGPLGYREINVPSFSPFTFFYYVFPGIDSLRAVSRLTSAAILLLLIGNINYLNKLNLKLLFLLPIIFLDSRSTAIPLAPLNQPPAIFSELLKHYQQGQAALIAPVSGALDKNRNIVSWSEVAALNSQYLVDLRHTPIKLLNGYSGQRPKSLYELPKIMARFPDQKSIDLLSRYQDLRWIVILGSKIDNFSEEKFNSEINNLSGRIKIIAQSGQDYLLEIS